MCLISSKVILAASHPPFAFYLTYIAVVYFKPRLPNVRTAGKQTQKRLAHRILDTCEGILIIKNVEMS